MKLALKQTVTCKTNWDEHQKSYIRETEFKEDLKEGFTPKEILLRKQQVK